jgi:signal transduction histidine kinase
VSRLAALHAQTTPQQLLSGLIETLAQTLRLSFARIELLAPDGTVSTVATYGTAHRAPVAVVMDALPDVRGRLLLDVGPGREPFGTADQKLLQAVAIHVGVALHTTLLAEALQRSRERLVTAREEERRRLQRDLHDGVGPTLAATAVQAEVAVELLQQDADAAQRALSLVAQQSKEALAEIRRIVHSLRPPALDQLGLVAAIRERVATFDLVPDAAHPRGFRTSVVAEEELPHLPAAVEVAAFAIVLEAVSNTARHAAASLCQVRLWCDNGLQVEVTDDGEGLPPDATRGVGLLSMTERAAELGGECSVTNRPSRGTIVHARIPLMHREVATP